MKEFGYISRAFLPQKKKGFASEKKIKSCLFTYNLKADKIWLDHRIPVSLIYEQGEINLKELLLFVSLFLPDSDMTEPEGILYCSLHSSLPIPLANTIPLESISNHSVHIETQS